MIRNVFRRGYLPDFLHRYAELVNALDPGDPEFVLVWEATDRVLKNMFIETADEYGISRFEKLLGLYPSKTDTLEVRRVRAAARWFRFLPYTWKVFLENVATICGDENFKVEINFHEGYEIWLYVDQDRYGTVFELEELIESMVPMNMLVHVLNDVEKEVTFPIYEGVPVVTKVVKELDSKLLTTIVVNEDVYVGTAIHALKTEIIDTEADEDTITVRAPTFYGSGAVVTIKQELDSIAKE